MILSMIFENTGRTEIDLSLATFSASLSLNKGVTFAIFNLLGKVLC